jgi:hypothetical protein
VGSDGELGEERVCRPQHGGPPSLGLEYLDIERLHDKRLDVKSLYVKMW